MFQGAFEAIMEMANSAQRRRRIEAMEALQAQTTTSVDEESPVQEGTTK